MKNLISKLSLILLLTTLSVFHLSGKDLLPNFQIKVVESNAFVLKLNDLPSDLSIQIKDATGRILVTKEVAQHRGAHQVKFILSDFKAGAYQLIVEDGLKITSTNLFKTEKWIELDQTQTIVHKPYFKLDGPILDVNLLNLKEKEVDISFLNENGNVVYAYKINDQQSINKRFDLSALNRANYLVNVTFDDQSFYKNISIK